MKMRWVRFADSFEELQEELNQRVCAPILVDGRGFLLVKHQDKYYLVKNKCPHQGAKLNNAVCEDGKIVCPWHRYGFDLETGRGAGMHLENYPVEKREDGLYAGFEYFSWFYMNCSKNCYFCSINP